MRNMRFCRAAIALAAAAMLCMNGCAPKNDGGTTAAATAAETTAAETTAAETTKAETTAAETTKAETTAAETTAAETTKAETSAAETAAAEETQKEEAAQAETAEAGEDEDSEGGPGADDAAEENQEIDEDELRGGKGRVVKSNTSGDLVKPEPTEGVMPEPPLQ